VRPAVRRIKGISLETEKPHRVVTAFADHLASDQSFFKNLPKLRARRGGDERFLRIFQFEGRQFVVKDTRGDALQGHEYGKMRAQLLAFQEAVRDKRIRPKRFVIRSMPVFGRHGNYLVLRYVPRADPAYGEGNYDSKAIATCEKAREEMDSLLPGFFVSRGPVPQYWDGVVAGNTRPQNTAKGKWIFYVPYDYI
jgi:hypothetical protein